MVEKLFVAKKGCDTCPFRRDTPSGIWDESEYEKLRDQDQRHFGGPGCATFHCHQQNATGVPTACRGWLWTQNANMGVRLAVISGRIAQEDLPQEDESHIYYDSGLEAYEAGMAEIWDPSPEATDKIQKLIRRGAGKVVLDEPDADSESLEDWEEVFNYEEV